MQKVLTFTATCLLGILLCASAALAAEVKTVLYAEPALRLDPTPACPVCPGRYHGHPPERR